MSFASPFIFTSSSPHQQNQQKQTKKKKERVPGFYARVAFGLTTAFATSIDKVLQEVSEIRPTNMGSVPRIYEKAFVKIMSARKVTFNFSSFQMVFFPDFFPDFSFPDFFFLDELFASLLSCFYPITSFQPLCIVIHFFEIFFFLSTAYEWTQSGIV